VLIAHRDDSIRSVLRDALHFEGYAVLTAADGSEALKLLATARPAVILTDALMPLMDGPTYLRAYHAGPGPHAAAVLLSSGPLPEQVAMLELVDETLPEPFDLELLLALVARLARSTPATDNRHT
jgi:CheY-like chemotaxis protein